MSDYELKQGDALAVLKTMPSESVQCCVTSPPYFGLRNYGHDGQIGLEPTPAEYVSKLVAVFEEVRRVLRSDGVCWINLGDSYAANRGSGNQGIGAKQATNTGANLGRLTVPDGFKAKDRMGIPHRVVFALQDAGWYWRDEIVWHKVNPMPESVTDRTTKAHEFIFLLTKSERYYYDHEAIKEPAKESSIARLGRGVSDEHKNIEGAPGQTPHSLHQPRPHKPVLFGGNKAEGYGTRIHSGKEWQPSEGANMANKRSVWSVATQPYAEAHFATYPPKLIEPCILAGSRADDTVLDCFNGSATTGSVALEHGRNYIGIELNPEYIALSLDRLEAVQPRLSFEVSP